jgi:hypothetical protein
MIIGSDSITKALIKSEIPQGDLVYYCDNKEPEEHCYCWCNSKVFYNANEAIAVAKNNIELCEYILFTNVYCPLTKLMKTILFDNKNKIHYYDLDKFAVRHLKDKTELNEKFKQIFPN